MTKDNSGNLFKNTFKEEGSKKPDFNGDVIVDGKVYKASLWINKDKNNNTYLGIKFQSEADVAKYSKKTSSHTPKPVFEAPSPNNTSLFVLPKADCILPDFL